MQSDEPAPRKILCSLFMAEELFEICGGEVDEGLEEISLLGAVARGMPQRFKHFVAFPPVGVVIEIDALEVIL